MHRPLTRLLAMAACAIVATSIAAQEVALPSIDVKGTITRIKIRFVDPSGPSYTLPAFNCL